MNTQQTFYVLSQTSGSFDFQQVTQQLFVLVQSSGSLDFVPVNTTGSTG